MVLPAHATGTLENVTVSLLEGLELRPNAKTASLLAAVLGKYCRILAWAVNRATARQHVVFTLSLVIMAASSGMAWFLKPSE